MLAFKLVALSLQNRQPSAARKKETCSFAEVGCTFKVVCLSLTLIRTKQVHCSLNITET